jgi:hypothetical protein
MDCKCEVCGKEFTAHVDGIHKGRYCSKECYYRGRWGESHKETLVCLECGKEFMKYKSNDKKFCSLECQYQWRSKNFRGAKHPRFKGRVRYGTNNKYWAIYAPYHPFCDEKIMFLSIDSLWKNTLKDFSNQRR